MELYTTGTGPSAQIVHTAKKTGKLNSRLLQIAYHLKYSHVVGSIPNLNIQFFFIELCKLIMQCEMQKKLKGDKLSHLSPEQ